MLIIRLQRTGKKNASSFRIVVAEKAAHVSKKVEEVLGHYNPGSKEFKIKNPERLQHWLGKNASMSATIHNLLIDKGFLKGEKVKAFSVPKKEEPKAEASVAPAPAAEAAKPDEAQPENAKAPAAEESAAPETSPAPVTEEKSAE